MEYSVVVSVRTREKGVCMSCDVLQFSVEGDVDTAKSIVELPDCKLNPFGNTLFHVTLTAPRYHSIYSLLMPCTVISGSTDLKETRSGWLSSRMGTS